MKAYIIVPALILAGCLGTAEAHGRTENTSAAGTHDSRTYPAPVDRAPDVLCGCTEVLKNFA